MVRRVPVLRHHHVGEALGDAVDHRDHLVAVFDRQTAARQEAVLHVHHDQGARCVGFDLVGRHRQTASSDQGIRQRKAGDI